MRAQCRATLLHVSALCRAALLHCSLGVAGADLGAGVPVAARRHRGVHFSRVLLGYH